MEQIGLCSSVFTVMALTFMAIHLTGENVVSYLKLGITILEFRGRDSMSYHIFYLIVVVE